MVANIRRISIHGPGASPAAARALSGGGSHELSWHWNNAAVGNLQPSQSKPPYTLKAGGITINYLHLELTPAATTGTTTVSVFKVGEEVPLATISVAPGVTSGTAADLDVAVADGAQLYMRADPVGTGITDALALVGYVEA